MYSARICRNFVWVAVVFICGLGLYYNSMSSSRRIPRIEPECNTCDKKCKNLSEYVTHCRTHRHDNNTRFSCCIPGCIRTFYTYKSLVSHISRNHNDSKHSNESQLTQVGLQVRDAGIDVECMLTVCKHRCSDLKELMSHLRGHIDSGLKIPCPFDPCGKQFDKKKSFSSHVSRYHRNYSIADVSPAYVLNKNVEVAETTASVSEYNTTDNVGPLGLALSCLSDLQDTDDECDGARHITKTVKSYGDEEYTKNIAIFLIKLQAKYLIPESSVQAIVEEMYFLNQVGYEHTCYKIIQKLSEAGAIDLGNEQVKNVANELFQNVSQLGCCLAPLQDSVKFSSQECGKLRSEYLRKKYFKNNLKYVSPEGIYGGKNKKGKKKYFHYVPILETVKLTL